MIVPKSEDSANPAGAPPPPRRLYAQSVQGLSGFGYPLLPMTPDRTSGTPRPDQRLFLASGMATIWAFALAKLVFHVYFNNRYGYFRDESITCPVAITLPRWWTAGGSNPDLPIANTRRRR